MPLPQLAPQPSAFPAAPAVSPTAPARPVALPEKRHRPPRGSMARYKSPYADLPRYRDLPPAAVEAYIQAVEAERVAADPWLLPAVDQREIAALGDAFVRPYHVLDQADLPGQAQEDGVSTSQLHGALCANLRAGLDVHYDGRRDVLAATEMGLYYDSTPDLGPACTEPDLMVAFDTAPQGRSSYLMWRERGRPPAFALEVLSPSTWKRDVGIKRDIYAKIGVRDYVVFDPAGHIAPRLRGYALWSGGYRRLPVEELPEGMLGVRCATLGLYLCHEEPWPAEGWRADGEPGRLRWYDPRPRRFSEAPKETAKRAEREAARADQEAARADAAEARVAELAARLRELNAGRP